MKTHIYYKAIVLSKSGTTEEVEILDFDVNCLGHDLWANVFHWDGYCQLRINDTKISDEDMYLLGFEKVISIKKVEVVETEKTIYEKS